MKILNTLILTAEEMGLEDFALSALGGYTDDGNEKGLGAFEVQFTVALDNGEECTAIFVPLERSNGMRSYSGWEMTTAGGYGCDADESHKLNDDEIKELESIAEHYAKQEMQNKEAF